ncbi:MAG TPA: beta-ketoacyl-ACP reductase, partial [Gammaproteobacteria bacterium]|nr:beta-ketoacyl-ACP reductase [Gammaproteobacteria bacterium]
MLQKEDNIGIAAIGYYIPDGIITTEEIARRSNIPEHVIIEHIGMHEKHIANEHETPSYMGTLAAQAALKKAGIPAEELDVIIYACAGLTDYTVWSSASKIQGIIGAKNASCFEVRNGCGAGNLALHLCKNWLAASKKQHGLIVCAEGLSKLINYADQDTLSLFMIGDGAAAAVISKATTNRILEYASYTDGTLVDYVKIPGGGTVHFPGDDTYNKNFSFFNISDTKALTYIFDHVYLKN